MKEEKLSFNFINLANSLGLQYAISPRDGEAYARVEVKTLQAIQNADKIIHNSLHVFGRDKQILKTVEELNELAVELMHFRDGKSTIEDVAGELADVMLMCKQMEYLIGQNVVEEQVRTKLVRLVHKVRDEQELRELKASSRKKQIDDFMNSVDRVALISKIAPYFTMKEISQRYGLSKSTVQRLCKKHEIKTKGALKHERM